MSILRNKSLTKTMITTDIVIKKSMLDYLKQACEKYQVIIVASIEYPDDQNILIVTINANTNAHLFVVGMATQSLISSEREEAWRF